MKIYLIGQKGIPAAYGGVERHVEELSTRLAKEGNDVFVYCRKYYNQTNKKEYKGVNLIYLPTIKTKHLDAIVHTFFACIDVLRRDVDIIHFHAIGPSSLLWIPKLFKRKATVISTFHSDDRNHRKWGFLARKCLGLGAYISVKWADKTIAVSKYQRDVHGAEFRGNLEYVPNGVPAVKNISPKLITLNWGLREEDYILTVSRLIKHKGIHHLIRAYLTLNTDKKLVIAGAGNYTDDYVKYLKNLAGNNKNIIFTGNQKGKVLAELYSNAYVFVQPSEAEGLSIALLEAMSYGKPVVCSDIEPNMEAVGNMAESFKTKSITELSHKLRFMLNNPKFAKEMGDKLRERALTEYSWNNIVKRILEVYKATINDSKNKDYKQAVNVKSA